MGFSRDQKAVLRPCPVEKSAIVHNRYGRARTAHQKAIILGKIATKDTGLLTTGGLWEQLSRMIHTSSLATRQ
jgi:hypothetical protein